MTAPLTASPEEVDAPFHRIVDELTRRGFLAGGLGAAALAGLAGCGAGDQPSGGGAPTAGPWTFTDDRGQRISLPARPERVVAFIDCAAALAGDGIAPVGYFGATGPTDPRNGAFDVAASQSVGTSEIDLEKLAALRPDLIVSNSWFADSAPNVINKAEATVARIAPVAVVSMLHRGVPRIVARYRELAVALGAPESASDESAYTRAGAAVREAAGAGLRVLVVYNHNDEGVWIADPDYWPFTQTLGELGLTMVRPGAANGDPVINVSWELLDQLDVDVILNQDTTIAASEQPTWLRMPAVAAGQVVAQDSAWYCFSYETYARLFTDLADDLRRMRPLT